MSQQIRVRSAIKEDLGRLLKIERASGKEDLLGEAEFYAALGRTKGGLLVALVAGAPVGYLSYRVGPTSYVVESIAVLPANRRQGIGKELLSRLKVPFRKYPRGKVVAPVRERDLSCQLFYKGCGFVWVRTNRASFSDPPDDGYVFEWTRDMVA
jgi:ribosomal-protein-alanine N-acetyltransferase